MRNTAPERKKIHHERTGFYRLSSRGMSGDAVSTAVATTGTVDEITKITMFAVAAVLLILFLTTTSWAEPLVVMLGLGVAIIINSGTNLLFGEISFVTNAVGAILQLAVSLDYSVFLIHRYEECLQNSSDRKSAKRERRAQLLLARGASPMGVFCPI